MSQDKVAEILMLLGYLIMVVTFIGVATFIFTYRPLNPRRHGRAGRHLLNMSYALLALYGVSLMGALVPVSPLLGAIISVLVLAGICYVVWERVVIARGAKSMAEQIDQAERETKREETQYE